jgi:hypothetical protein
VQSGDIALGDWGVNTANHTVWAVVNHNSQFAVVPEPSTLVLLTAAALGLLSWRRRACHRSYGLTSNTIRTDAVTVNRAGGI